ncbi:hypothetical protein NDU88_001132 [Pleurodeles waltl]|uniref:Reverse transcriptase domain-containing protein n=1 Tax=Pleurodeles waltl TaxID=8319 RepID=A0AAV7RC33_PLEWA|nr:hypothetical protein NDU88_001132 [Pleurodeles waltl]
MIPACAILHILEDKLGIGRYLWHPKNSDPLIPDGRVVLSKLEDREHEEHLGFRPRVGTVDQSLNLYLITQKYLKGKKESRHLAFMDLTCAFDFVQRPKLYNIMEAMGCTGPSSTYYAFYIGKQLPRSGTVKRVIHRLKYILVLVYVKVSYIKALRSQIRKLQT